jgi:hypothetical protein
MEDPTVETLDATARGAALRRALRRLAEARGTTPVPNVLHGGSGVRPTRHDGADISTER